MPKHVSLKLKLLRNRAGMSRDTLAQACGYAGGSSYQRYEDPALFTGESLPQKLIDRLLAALVGRGNPPITEREILELGYASGLPVLDVDSLPVLGRVGAGLWIEHDEIAQEPKQRIPFAREPMYEARRQFAFQVDGESANRVLPNGSFAICVENYGQHPRNGDLVIALRRRSGTMERTVKRYQERGPIVELHPVSTDPSYKPIILDGPEADGTTVEIEAYVIGMYQRFTLT